MYVYVRVVLVQYLLGNFRLKDYQSGSGISANASRLSGISSNTVMPVSDAKLQWYVQQWGMEGMPQGAAWAKEWAEVCETQTWFATVKMITYVYDGVQGILLLESTPASTAKYKENSEVFQQGGLVDDPYWMYFNSSFYPGLSFLNFRGMVDGHKSVRPLGPFGDLVDRELESNVWRQQYCAVGEGYYLGSFRRLLSEVLKAPFWAEILFGHSKQQYACLDAYIRILAYGMTPWRDHVEK